MFDRDPQPSLHRAHEQPHRLVSIHIGRHVVCMQTVVASIGMIGVTFSMGSLDHPPLRRAAMVDRLGALGPSGGIQPADLPVGQEPNPPPMSMFDPVMSSAQADQVGGGRGAMGPGHDMVEVALTG